MSSTVKVKTENQANLERKAPGHVMTCWVLRAEQGVAQKCPWDWWAPAGDRVPWSLPHSAPQGTRGRRSPLTKCHEENQGGRFEKQQISKKENKFLSFLSSLYKYRKCEFSATYTTAWAVNTSEGRNQKEGAKVLSETHRLALSPKNNFFSCRPLKSHCIVVPSGKNPLFQETPKTSDTK